MFATSTSATSDELPMCFQNLRALLTRFSKNLIYIYHTEVEIFQEGDHFTSCRFEE